MIFSDRSWSQASWTEVSGLKVFASRCTRSLTVLGADCSAWLTGDVLFIIVSLRVRSGPKVILTHQCDPKKPAKSRVGPACSYLRGQLLISLQDNRRTNIRSLVRSNEFLPYIARRVTVAFRYNIGGKKRRGPYGAPRFRLPRFISRTSASATFSRFE